MFAVCRCAVCCELFVDLLIVVCFCLLLAACGLRSSLVARRVLLGVCYCVLLGACWSLLYVVC